MAGDWSRIQGVRWVHVFEEDGPAGAVYRRDSADIPLSRRPRRAFELGSDGAATLYTGGPDDRAVPHRGTWHVEGDAALLRFPHTAGAGVDILLHVVAAAAGRLLVTEAA